VADRDRTTLFAQYSLAGALLGAVGTLLAGVPALAARWLHTTTLHAMQDLFVLYALIGLVAGVIYLGISEVPVEREGSSPPPLGPSRHRVYQLATLFCVDAFGGGFIVQSMLALWLFKRFDLSVATTATLFFWASLLTAVSYLAAPPIARRIGLVR